MNKAQLNKQRGASCFGDNDVGAVRYHNTVVVDWDTKAIRLCTGGWQTPATKRRMNQASDVFGLGFRVYQKDYKFYVEFRGESYGFYNNCLTLRRGNGTL
jgi:hypothetical protein